MKKGIYLILVFMLACQITIAQEENSQPTGTIYFLRLPNFYASAARMKILIGDLPVIRLKSGSVYKHEVTPGEYIISSKMASLAQLKLIIEPGQSYYVKCYINPGFWSGIPVMELVDDQAGKALVEGGMLVQQEYEPISKEKATSRVGFFMGGGGGFEKIEMGYTDEGDDLTLSTGGGFAIGAEYGHEVNKFLDFSVNLFFQGSSLAPPVKNMNASFNRLGITLTPALIIPIKGGDYFRFRLGAGPGLYTAARMKVEASGAGGEDFKLGYTSAIGIHSSLVFESNFSERGSFSMGLKYYHVNYNYSVNNSTGWTTDPKAAEPNGSGLDFMIGYYFRF